MKRGQSCSAVSVPDMNDPDFLTWFAICIVAAQMLCDAMQQLVVLCISVQEEPVLPCVALHGAPNKWCQCFASGPYANGCVRGLSKDVDKF